MQRRTTRCNVVQHGATRRDMLPHGWAARTIQRSTRRVAADRPIAFQSALGIDRSMLNTPACIPICMQECINTRMHACMPAYMHTDMHAYMHACLHACMHAYIHAYLHAYIHRSYVHAYESCMHTYDMRLAHSRRARASRRTASRKAISRS